MVVDGDTKTTYSTAKLLYTTTSRDNYPNRCYSATRLLQSP